MHLSLIQVMMESCLRIALIIVCRPDDRPLPHGVDPILSRFESLPSMPPKQKAPAPFLAATAPSRVVLRQAQDGRNLNSRSW